MNLTLYIRPTDALWRPLYAAKGEEGEGGTEETEESKEASCCDEAEPGMV